MTTIKQDNNSNLLFLEHSILKHKSQKYALGGSIFNATNHQE